MNSRYIMWITPILLTLVLAFMAYQANAMEKFRSENRDDIKEIRSDVAKSLLAIKEVQTVLKIRGLMEPPIKGGDEWADTH